MRGHFGANGVCLMSVQGEADVLYCMYVVRVGVVLEDFPQPGY